MQVSEIKNNIVQRVIVADSVEWCITTFGGEWIRTYYNKDNFSSPQPYPSWTLDADCLWQPPVPYPNDGCLWTWDEETLTWINPICPPSA
jgi:hypothetical protein